MSYRDIVAPIDVPDPTWRTVTARPRATGKKETLRQLRARMKELEAQSHLWQSQYLAGNMPPQPSAPCPEPATKEGTQAVKFCKKKKKTTSIGIPENVVSKAVESAAEAYMREAIARDPSLMRTLHDKERQDIVAEQGHKERMAEVKASRQDAKAHFRIARYGVLAAAVILGMLAFQWQANSRYITAVENGQTPPNFLQMFGIQDMPTFDTGTETKRLQATESKLAKLEAERAQRMARVRELEALVTTQGPGPDQWTITLDALRHAVADLEGVASVTVDK